MKSKLSASFFDEKLTWRAKMSAKKITKIIAKWLVKLGLKTGQKQGLDSGLLDPMAHDRVTVHGQGTLIVRPFGCKISNPCLAK